ALAPVDEIRFLLERAEELGHEAALADPRNADEGHELGRMLLSRPLERALQELHLLLAPDERRPACARDVDSVPGAGLDHLPNRNRLRLALGLDGVAQLVGDRLLGR